MAISIITTLKNSFYYFAYFLRRLAITIEGMVVNLRGIVRWCWLWGLDFGYKKGCSSTSEEMCFLNGSKFNSEDSRHLIGQMGIMGPQISEGHFSIHFRVDYFRVAPNTVLNPPCLNTSEPHFRTPKHALSGRLCRLQGLN